MTKKEIDKIEKEFPADGLAGHLFFKFCDGNYDNLCEVASLPEGGAGLILKGTASIQERREQFLQVYDGCRNISEYLKKK